MEELRSALHEHEARIEQLLDAKLEQHCGRLAEALARQLGEFSQTVAHPARVSPLTQRQGSQASDQAIRVRRPSSASPISRARASPGSTVGRVSGFHGSSVLPSAAARRLSRNSRDSDYWLDCVDPGQTHENLREATRQITQGKSAASIVGTSSRTLKRQRTQISQYNSMNVWIFTVYTSQWSELCLAALIVANSVSIGVFAEWSIQHIDEPAPLWFNIANLFFASAFSVEIAMRCLVEGKWFASPQNMHFGWNVFDSLLVVLALIEEVLRLFAVSAFKMSFLRLARLLRLVRVIRLFRLLRFFKELRLMAFGILHCAKPLAWASLFLGMLSYIFVVFLLQISAVWSQDKFRDPAQAREAIDRALGGHFPTLLHGMYTLFMSISGGLNWSEVSDTLQEISPVLVLAFCMYIVISMFCVCNVITSVFLEAAHTKNADEEANVLEHMQTKQEWMQEAGAFLSDLVQEEILGITNESGQPLLSWASFETLVHLPRTKAFFQEQGLDIYFEKPKAVFELIDLDGDGAIDLNEFIVGMHRLKGGARSLDMHLEMRQTMKKIDKLRELSAEIHQMFQALGPMVEISQGGSDASPIAGHPLPAWPTSLEAPQAVDVEAESEQRAKCQSACESRGVEPTVCTTSTAMPSESGIDGPRKPVRIRL